MADQTLIINLPGSPRGAGQTLQHLADVLPHALDLLRNPDATHPPPSEADGPT